MKRNRFFVLSILLALLTIPASAKPGGHGGQGGHQVGQHGGGGARAARQHDQGGQRTVKARGARRGQGGAAEVRRHANQGARAIAHESRRAARGARAAERHVAHEARAIERHAVAAERHTARRSAHEMRAIDRHIAHENKRIAKEQERALRRDEWIARRSVDRGEVRAVPVPGRTLREERIARGPFGGDVGRGVAGRPERFRGLDVNGDGVVTRAEWRGNNRSFANHDWNADGILDGNEVIPGAGRGRVVNYVDHVPFFERFLPLPRRLVSPVPLGLPLAAPGGVIAALPAPEILPMPPLEAAFPFRLDVPRLQSVVRVQGFGPVDLMVTRPAVVPLDRVLLNNDFLALDVNRDSFVTLSEWTGPRPLFWRLDTNRDRRVVYTELVAPTYQPTYVTAPVYAPLRSTVLVGRDRFVQFDLLDRSNDGLIAPWEWTGDMDLFFLLDRNGDGLLEQPEFLGVGVARPVVPVRMVVDGALDLDHDGYVSRWEWVGDPFRFAALDLNGNGRLGRVEAVIGTAL